MRLAFTPFCSVLISSMAIGCAVAGPGCAQPLEAARPVGTEYPSVGTPELQSMIRTAVDDAARRTGSVPASISVVLAEAVTWPDSSLGCPQPGRSYLQVLVPGYLIRLSAGKEQLEYHAGAKGDPFYCPAGRDTLPSTDRRV